MDYLRRLFGKPPAPTLGDADVPPALAYRDGPDGRYVPDHDYDFSLYLDTLEGQALRDFLDLHVSPAVAALGLKWRGDYYWVGESVGGVRRVLHYSILPGRGTFIWGMCLDFVKVASGNKLVFNRTERTARLHLFEHASAYSGTFSSGHIADAEGFGVVCHARCRAEHTLTRSLAHLLGPMRETFERMGTLDGLVAEARRQVAEATEPGNIYRMHAPSPAYVLAFCYAELGRHEEALATLAEIRDASDFHKLGLAEAYLRKLAET